MTRRWKQLGGVALITGGVLAPTGLAWASSSFTWSITGLSAGINSREWSFSSSSTEDTSITVNGCSNSSDNPNDGLDLSLQQQYDVFWWTQVGDGQWSCPSSKAVAHDYGQQPGNTYVFHAEPIYPIDSQNADGSTTY